MLIAQALHEGFRLVTRDPEIAKDPVPQIVARAEIEPHRHEPRPCPWKTTS